MSFAGVANPLDSWQHRFSSTAILLSTASINILSLALPIATLQIYDRVLNGHNIGTLRVLMFGVITALLIETFLRLARAFLVTRAGAAYVHGTSCSVLDRQFSQNQTNSEQRSVAKDLAGLTAIKSMKDFESGNASIIIVDLMFLPLYIGVMAYISQSLVLVPVSLLCAFAIITAFNGVRVRDAISDATEADENRHDLLLKCLASAEVMKSLALESLMLRRFERFHEHSCRTNYSLSRTIAQTFLFGTALGTVMTAATVSIGAYMAVHGQLTIGVLIAVVLLANRLVQPVQKAVLLWLKFQDYQEAKERVHGMLRGASTEADEEVVAPPASDNCGKIDVVQLVHRHTPNSPVLLDGVSLSLERGETISLEGGPGSGKTTLLKLIAGINTPESGKVRINGVDPTRLSASDLARQVGYLAPRAHLFRGTIRDNITRFSQVSSAQALEVASLLSVTDELARMPLGIDTPVGGDSNTTLTPGMMRMICVLRVLAAKPRIILFDEADNGLDTHHYNALLSLLARLKPHVAMIIVSRDIRIRQLAERSVFLNDGRLIETGTKLHRFSPLETRL
ncbi:MAG: ATP-binding cassette domain-containing protein [Alphaproteobacteria bacterium]|nr:ATP-binding cassette domain-containing protein [Alphaproteobacteria bacterium]